jgi:hypothetical protein
MATGFASNRPAGRPPVHLSSPPFRSPAAPNRRTGQADAVQSTRQLNWPGHRRVLREKMILVVRDRQTTERKSSYWLAQVPAMALALLLAGLFFADERWLAAASAPAWGIGYLVFLPLWLRWAAGAAILATALAALRWSPARPGEGRQWRPSPYRWAAVPGMMLLFWLLREQTWHGDALYKLQLLAAETLQSNT